MKLYNTLTKKKEEFKPISENKLGIYFCGMTVQDAPHLGHFRAFIAGDVLRRYLEYKGWTVEYILNFTDIDDKIIEKSKKEGVDWRKIADRYIKEYFDAEKSMNLKPASFYPRATQHIQEILEMIKIIEKKGYAYRGANSANVWFDVSKFTSYGKLSGKTLSELLEGVRIEPDPTKIDPLDFSLWKSAKKGEPYYFSPYGQGRPGWHIECSAMSKKYLGESFDIHGGGEDLIFPHHENEIAQSESATGKPLAKLWFHSGLLNLKGEKMSKSKGHFFRIKDILEEFSPNVVRLYFLRSHYRSQIDFSRDYLLETEKAWKKIEDLLQKSKEKEKEMEFKSKELQKYLKEFESFMDDDLNTPKAISLIFSITSLANTLYEQNNALFLEVRNLLIFLLSILGFSLELTRFEEKIVHNLIELIIEVRQRLREEKQFSLSDKIREKLKSLGIILEDGTKKTEYKFYGKNHS